MDDFAEMGVGITIFDNNFNLANPLKSSFGYGMGYKGHVGTTPCRGCYAKKEAIQFGSKRLKWISPSVEEPLRTHQKHKRYLQDFDPKEKKKNSVEAINNLGSIIYPWSFTLDIMHMVYENIMKTTVLHDLFFPKTGQSDFLILNSGSMLSTLKMIFT